MKPFRPPQLPEGSVFRVVLAVPLWALVTLGLVVVLNATATACLAAALLLHLTAGTR